MEELNRDYYEMSLAEIREAKGFSRKSLAEKLSGQVSEDTLYSIEKRGQVPRMDTAILIAQGLNISLKQLCHSIGLDVSDIPGE